MEFNFDYIDATFTIPSDQGAGAAVAGKTYTVRVFYVNDGEVSDIVSGTSSTVSIGDKLLKGPNSSTFSWCDGSSCSHTTRPSGVLRDDKLVNYSFPGEGNTNYVVFSVNLATPMVFTKTNAETGDWLFSVDFSVANAAIFSVSSWASITSESEMVNAFRLLGEPGSQGTSVTVDLSKSAVTTPSPSPSPSTRPE
jgi:hypothetical protein